MQVIVPRLSAEHQRALVALRHGDVGPIEAALDRTVGEGRTSDRICLLRMMARVREPRGLMAMVSAFPDAQGLTLLAASALIEAGWASRGGGTADEVDDRGATLFFHSLALADQLLDAATSLDPGDPVPWILRFRTGPALTSELSPFEHCYREAIARDPDCWYAHAGMLWLSTEKWYGSHDTMFRWARSMASRPDGDPLRLLIAEAHIEMWVYLHLMEGDAAGAAAYLRRPEVLAEVATAFDGFRAGAPRHIDAHLARNSAAFWFYLAGDRARLRAAFQPVPVYFERPWQFLAGQESYVRARGLVGA